MAGGLPSGTLTLVFTDIEGSTRLLRAAGDEYASLLEDHRGIIREAIARHGGVEVKTGGDSFFIVFQSASAAIAAALDAQLGLCAHPWPEGREIRVRMGVHTGEASVVFNDYVGLSVHQAARISAAAHGRQVLVSATTADLAAGSVPDAASLRSIGSHALKDFDRPIQLFQLVHPALPGDFASPTSAGAFPSNLPRPMASFVGRDEDLAESERQLRTTRLLTLTGAGGVGKTRLAFELAASAIRDYPDGAWAVELASVASPELVAQAAGTALGVSDPEGTTSWLDRVVDHLRDKTALLVLDNCEHVVAACAELVVSLLREARGLRIIATSREPLGLEGEVAWRVPSLAISEDEHAGAVRLFIDRARELTPSFAGDLGVIAEICRNLDGIPLAIELAAARTQALTCEQILSRLDDRYRLLRGGGQRRIERQQTLRAAIDWSYDLLDETERTALRRASVFSGGFTLDAAEAVCADAELESDEVLDLLEGLIRKSLVEFDPERGRYKMLETIRQYALEKLVASGAGSAVRAAHRAFFSELVEDCERLGFDGRDVEANDRVEADLDNIRGAMDWEPDAEEALRIYGGLLVFFMTRGQIAEALQRGRALLAADVGPRSVARLKALAVAHLAAFHRYDIGLVAELSEEGLELAERLGPDLDGPAVVAHVGHLIGLGCVALQRDNDLSAGVAAFERAVELGRSAGHNFATAWPLFNLGSVLANNGDLLAGLAALEEAAVLAGMTSAATMVLPSLAVAVLASGDPDRAREIAGESLRSARESRNTFAVVRALGALSAIALQQGDYDLARSSAEEQVVLGKAVDEKLQGVASGHHNLALAHRAAGDATRALSEAEEGLRVTMSTGLTESGEMFRALISELRGGDPAQAE